MPTNYDKTKRYFPKNISKRERGIFECGIALVTIYHAFTGVPVKYFRGRYSYAREND